MTSLNEGQKAPGFTAKDQNGNTVSLKDFIGKKVVLYFYPEDDTPTCTIEACNLRDNYKLLGQKGLVILGVSPDDEKKHKKFEEKYKLPFTLVADPQKRSLKNMVCGARKIYMAANTWGCTALLF